MPVRYVTAEFFCEAERYSRTHAWRTFHHSGRMRFMAKKNVRFVAVKTVAKPARVKFKTKSGQTVSFKALKTVKERQVVKFRARGK